jgi:hypothetical protein
MSTPRDRDGDGFDDGRTDGPAGWQEPAHLGRDGEGTPGSPPDPAPDPAHDPAPQAWQPPGWDLPAVEPERPAATPPVTPPAQQWQQPPAEQQPWAPPSVDQRTADAPPPGERRRGLGGLFGSRPPVPDPGRPVEQPVEVPPADPWGTQAWAMSIGWQLSDGTAPEDEPLTALVRSAPVRPGKEALAGRVLRGRGNGLDLVAFDIVSPVGRGWVSTHAITAAPVLGAVPAFRLSPARMWRHGVGGMVQVPSPDPEFDRRWVLLAAEDGPQLRRLVEDPVVRQLLLGSDDGDELWSAAGFVAAIRPDGNRPQLIEHHARLLAAVVGVLAAGV